MDESIIFAKKYIEDLLSFFGLNTDVYATSEDGEVIELHVPSSHMNGFLIGQNAETLRAMQYMVSMALRNKEYEVSRVNVDVADYKKQRAHRLEETAVKWLQDVKESGQEKHLKPMNAADRRTIHKLAEEYGLTTVSEGFGRDRHIVLRPAGAAPESEKESEIEE
jgi:spoIIIJ-associated protein